MEHWNQDGVFKLHSPDRSGWVHVDFTKCMDGKEYATVSTPQYAFNIETGYAASYDEQLASLGIARDSRVDSSKGDGTSHDFDGTDIKISC